jgi:hypothetical protein
MSLDPYRSVPQVSHPIPRSRLAEWGAVAAMCVTAALHELVFPAGHVAPQILVTLLGGAYAVGAVIALYAYCRGPVRSG